MLDLTHFENAVTFRNALYDYDTPKESLLALAKIFGHCWQNGMENNPQCRKVQSFVTSFVQPYHFDFCKFWGQSNLAIRCGMGGGWLGEEISLEAAFEQNFLRINDVKLTGLALNCQAFDLGIEPSPNAVSLLCHVNDPRLYEAVVD